MAITDLHLLRCQRRPPARFSAQPACAINKNTDAKTNTNENTQSQMTIKDLLKTRLNIPGNRTTSHPQLSKDHQRCYLPYMAVKLRPPCLTLHLSEVSFQPS